MPAALLPSIHLPVFDGPLDLLLHLVREHKLDIADIPIEFVTDHYLAYLRDMEAQNLALAGEFFLMAATLLEIKSRMLLPKPPAELSGSSEEALDPRAELAERLREYERFHALVGTLQGWEEARSRICLRADAAFGDRYELPASFGEVPAEALARALATLLELAAPFEQEITIVRRHKLTLRLAMRELMGRAIDAGGDGLLFDDAFRCPPVRLEIVMTFLALLELMKEGRVRVKQRRPLAPIRIYALPGPGNTRL